MNAEFRLLGPLELRRDGQSVPLRAAKQRLLLANLLVHRGEVVSVDRLVDDLWQESPPRNPQHALEAQVSRLRAALTETVPIVSRSPGTCSRSSPTRWTSSGSNGWSRRRRGPTRNRRPHSRPRHSSSGGGRRSQIAPMSRSRRRRSTGSKSSVGRRCTHGSTPSSRSAARDLIPELESLVATEPLRGRLVAHLMLALYRAGRQADALAAFRDLRERLDDELGLEPDPELRELETKILRHDESLARPGRAVPAAPQRKLATILFADVADSTGLAVSLDPEALRAVLRRYFDVASAAVTRHGGTVEKFVGDAVMAVFGTPLAHEDDALRAARAAVEIREAVALLDEELERTFGVRLAVRLGLASGEVLTGGAGEPMATGPATIVANRLQQEVAPGEIAVDALTRRLTAAAARYEELGAVSLRGFRQPTLAFRLVELVPGASAVERRLDAPLVGREPELATLRDALAATTSGNELRAVTVLGAPGIGKSRLARELVVSVGGDATVLLGRCDAYGEGASFRAAPGGASQRRGRRRGVRLRLGCPRGGSAVGVPAVLRDARVGATPRARPRRPPLGRAGAARPRRVPRRVVERRTDRARVHRA